MPDMKSPGAHSATGTIKGVELGGSDAPEYTPAPYKYNAPVADVRAVWWSQRRHGVPLPPQRGVIVLSGLGE